MEEKQLELIGDTCTNNLTVSTVNSTTVNTSIAYDIPLQSAYRPSARPTSKYAVSSPELVISTSGNTVTVAKGMYNMHICITGMVCFQEKDTTSDNQSLQIPRTKSTTRRKPKEKRRSTGIPTEVSIMNSY